VRAIKTAKEKPFNPCPEEEPLPLDESQTDETLAKLSWAIAHPARVKLLRILIARSSCVCGELVELMPLSQSTVSQHLKILKDAGIVQGEIDGPKVCYCVNQKGLAVLKALINGL
jgi:ArsR family transcriptional regulator